MTKHPLLKVAVLTACIVFACTGSQAQGKYGVINSGAIINQGVEYHDNSKYDEAIKLFNQVPENDTNYTLALAEKAFSYYEKKDYDKTIEICEKALAMGTDYDHSLYVTLGSAYDDNGKPEKALETYERGMKAYPKNHQILFNKAVTLQKMGKYNEAIETYQAVLRISPYHASTHYRLGAIAQKEGDLTRAMLCYNTFLLVEPTSNRSINVLLELDKMVASKYDNSEAKGIELAKDGEDFGEIEQLIRKQLALNKNYKLESKADYPINRQNQALFSYLVNHRGRSGFWETFYVPFYAQLYKEGHFEEYSYFILASSDNEKIKSLVSKNKGDIARFNDWQTKAYAEHTTHYKTDINGKQTEVTQNYYKTGKLYGIGPFVPAEGKNPEKRIGAWKFYYATGRLMSEGAFDNSGEQTGTWKFYYTNGKLKKETVLNAGKENGAYKIYHTNGNLKEEGYFTNGELDKEIKTYTIFGGLEEIHHFKNGVREGKYEEYYPNGKLHNTYNYVNNKLNGDFKNYHPNGEINIEGKFKDDMKEGQFVSYFDDKKLELKKTYLANKENGPFVRYYHNGKLKQEGEFKNGKQTGTWKLYWRNGLPDEITTFNDAGNEDGIAKYYDIDGKQYYEGTFKDGRLLQYKYIDKSGNIVSDVKVKPKQDYKNYYANGAVHYTGEMADGKRNGVWKEYQRNGLLNAEYTYTDGSLNGAAKTYYNNGKVFKQFNYKNGEADGEYKEYYRDGQLYKSCWYANGNVTGDITIYNSDGSTDQTYSILNGKQTGISYIYNVDGKLNVKEEYDAGNFIAYTFYDTTGKPYPKAEINKDKVDAIFISQVGVERMKRTYLNGSKEGLCKSYFLDNKIESEGNYLNDEREGTWKWYNPDNTINTERNYHNGQNENAGLLYDLFGKLRAKYQYEDGDLQGLSEVYYYNGNKKEEVTNWQGSENGPTKYYGFNGEHVMTLIYDWGTLDKVVYINGKGGKPDTVAAPLNGTIEAKYANGKTAFILNYKNGYQHGDYREFFEDGTPCRSSQYSEDFLEGERKTWYRNGKLRSVESFKANDDDGLFVLYNENGTKKAELNYKLDNLHGPVKYYDSNGKLIAHYIFYNNNMIKKVL